MSVLKRIDWPQFFVTTIIGVIIGHYLTKIILKTEDTVSNG